MGTGHHLPQLHLVEWDIMSLYQEITHLIHDPFFFFLSSTRSRSLLCARVWAQTWGYGRPLYTPLSGLFTVEWTWPHSFTRSSGLSPSHCLQERVCVGFHLSFFHVLSTPCSLAHSHARSLTCTYTLPHISEHRPTISWVCFSEERQIWKMIMISGMRFTPPILCGKLAVDI